MEKISDIFVAKQISRNMDTNAVHVYAKGFLLSTVVSFEEFIGDDYDENPHDKTYIETEFNCFVLLMHWKDFKKVWAQYKRQQEMPLNLLAN